MKFILTCENCQKKFPPESGYYVCPICNGRIKIIYEFIKAEASIISVDSALVDKKAIYEKKFEVLTKKAGEFVEEIQSLEVFNK